MQKMLSDLTAALAKRRAALGASQQDVADATGVSKSTVNRIEAGNFVGRPQAGTVYALMQWCRMVDPKAVVAPGGDALPAIKRLLAKDPRLNDNARHALYDLMQAAYDHVTQPRLV